MAQVSLKSLTDEARELIKRNAFDEAIAIGRHVLRHYPKCLDAYRLLGEACAGSGMHDQAADLFSRVLSVDPENVVTRQLLSRVYEAKGDPNAALYQMRVAFDLSPSIADIRTELHRLLRTQSPGGPRRLKLTRQGLGRIYLRGGLYTQAADEFESLLHEDPEQLDVEVSLAEALWRDGQRIRSIEVCQNILNKLPDCLKANLILGETWLRSDRQDEGEAHLQKVRAMDPAGELSYALMGDSSPIARLSPALPAPGETENMPLGTEGMPSWLATAEADSTPAELHEETTEDMDVIPDWLRDAEGATAVQGTSTWLDDAASSPSLEATDEATSPTEEPVEPTAVENMPNWLREIQPEAEANGQDIADMPDWLRDAEPKEGGQPEQSSLAVEDEKIVADQADTTLMADLGAGSLADEIEPVVAGDTIEVEGLPAWLKDLGPSEQADDAEEAIDQPSAPSWLQDIEPQPAQSDMTEPEPADDGDGFESEESQEIPSWLRAMHEETVERPKAESEIDETEGVDGEEEAPAWLKEAWRFEAEAESGATVEPTAVETPGSPEKPAAEPLWTEEVEQIPDWLREAGDATPPVAAEPESALSPEAEPAAAGTFEPVAEGELPNWTRILKKQDLEAELPTEEQLAAGMAAESEPATAEAVEPVAEGELPDWMRILKEEGLEGELPTEEQLAAAMAAEPEPPTAEAVEPVAEDELPEWMRILKEEGLEAELPTEEQLAAAMAAEPEPPTAEAVEPVAEDELPDWMRILKEEGLEGELSTEEQLAAAMAAEPEPPTAEAVEPIAEDELPDWMRILKEEGLEGELPTEEQLAAAMAAEPEPPTAEAVEPVAEDELPDWMRILKEEGLEGELPTEEQLAAAMAAEPEPPTAEAVEPVAEDELPDWMRILKEEGLEGELPTEEQLAAAMAAEPEPPTAEAVEPVAEGELPDWMRILKEEGLEGELPTEEQLAAAMAAEPEPPTAEAVEPVAEGELPDWMRILKEEGLEAELPTEEQLAAAIAAESFEAVDAELSPIQDAPEWLASLRADGLTEQDIPNTGTTAEAQPLVEGEESSEVEPDWLRIIREEGLKDEEGKETPVAGEAEPDDETMWLRILREEGLEGELPSEADLTAAGLMSAREDGVESKETELLWTDAEPGSEEEQPAWLRILHGERIDLVPEQRLQEAGLMQEEVSAIEEEEDDILILPDWLRKAAIDEGLLKPDEETFVPAAQGEIEAGPAELLPEAVQAVAIPLVAPDTHKLADEPAPLSADWLEPLRAAGLATMIMPEDTAPEAQTALAPEREIPAWLRILRQGRREEPAAPAVTAQSEEEIPQPEPTPLPPGVDVAERPLWVYQLAESREEPEIVDGLPALELSAELESGATAPGTASQSLEVEPPVEAAEPERVEPEAETPPPPPDWYAELRLEASAAELGTDEAPTVEAEPEGPAENTGPVDAPDTESYEAALRSNPRDHQTRWKLAEVYAASGNHEAAFEHSVQLVQSGEMIGQVTQYLESAIREGVQARNVYQLLGDAYFKNGMLEEAVDAYRKALATLY